VGVLYHARVTVFHLCSATLGDGRQHQIVLSLGGPETVAA